MPEAVPGSIRLHYLTHPQVRIDPAVPVPRWGLSEIGRARVARFAASAWIGGINRVVASAEVKALETAEPIARRLGVAVEVVEESHENDRSATGFLAPAAFEATADRFFAEPDTSIRGWETARAAQARIVQAVTVALAGHGGQRVLVVGHGAVGTLLACHLAGRPISRAHDQPAGGGNLWTADWPAGGLVHDWRAMEAIL